MDRRDFIQKGSLLTGGLFLNHHVLKAINSRRILRVGIIGCGDRGQGILHELCAMPEEFTVTAICDTLDFRIKSTTSIPGSARRKVYRDYRKLLDNKRIDAVVIATPLHLHFQMAVDALEAGKHVFLEKTMTYSISEANALVKIAKKCPAQILQVGHQYRYTPLYFKVKEMIEKGYLGKITQIDCRWDRNNSWRRPLPDPALEKLVNWRMYKEYSGGLVAELLSHQIDFINWAFDTVPDKIMASGGIDYFKDGRETYDNVQAILRYDNVGMIGNFGATCSNSKDGYLFKLKGTKGTISLLMNQGIYYPEPPTKNVQTTVDGVTGATNIEWSKTDGTNILEGTFKGGTHYALKDFYKCINENLVPTSNVITGATTATCVHLANEALYTGTIQNWQPLIAD